MLYKEGDKFKDIGGYEHTVVSATMRETAYKKLYEITYQTVFIDDEGLEQEDEFVDELDTQELLTKGIC